MKRYALFILFVIVANIGYALAGVTIGIGADWGNAVIHDYSVVTNNRYPDFDEEFTRGGDFDGKYVLLANRTAPKLLKIEDLLSDNANNPILLDQTGVEGGTHVISAGRLAQGHVYLCNLTTFCGDDMPLKVYHYATPTSKPDVVLSWDGTGLENPDPELYDEYSYKSRIGDNLSISLDENGNGYAFFFKQEADNRFFRWTVKNFTEFSEPKELALPAISNYYAMMNPVGNGQYVVKSSYNPVMWLMDADVNVTRSVEWLSSEGGYSSAFACDPRVIEFNGARYIMLMNARRFSWWKPEGVNVWDISEGDDLPSALTNLQKHLDYDPDEPEPGTSPIEPCFNYTMDSGTNSSVSVSLCNCAVIDGKLIIFCAAPHVGFAIIEVPPFTTRCPIYGKFGAEGNNLTWTLSCDSILTISGKGEMGGSASLPWNDFREIIKRVVLEDGVTNISENAFHECTNLTSIEIPASVVRIDRFAFDRCLNLTSVTIPNSVQTIGTGAFQSCSGLETTTLPNSITSIGDFVFSGCYRLYAITIPNSVTSIGDYAFQGSALTNITVPTNVKHIGCGAFMSCSNLAEMTLLCQTPPELACNENLVFENAIRNIYVPCGSLDEYKNAWSYYDSYIKYQSIQYLINGKVNIPEAGYVVIPTNECEPIYATSNYGYHFTQWSDGNKNNPRTIELSQDTTFTAEFAFDKSGTCGNNNALTWKYDDNSKTLVISGNGELNYNYTFGLEAPKQAERLIIEEGVTSIGNSAFKHMTSLITSVVLSSTVTVIGDYAFAGLNNRKFNTLVLPNTIKKIGAHAFDGAAYLQTIHFGSVLEEIGEYAFNGCTRVRKMTCLAEITPNVGTDGLTSISDLAELYVPDDYLFDYQLDNNWNRFQLKALGATETTVTSNDVTIVTDDNTATFTWPTNNTADSYTIEITKDGIVFCQLIFNANGQLTGIAFAPSRDGQASAPAATMTAAGMQFTVTGLNSGTNYAFSLTAKSGNTVVASYTGAFETTGAIEDGIDDLIIDGMFNGSQKILHNGQLFILRDGKTYNLQGQEVK